MSTRQFAAQFRTLIEDVKAKGTAAIYCDNLIDYLKEVENSPEPELTPLEIEKYKADLQNWIEANKSGQETQLEVFRSVISSGQSAIKSSFLLNGGAAVRLNAGMATRTSATFAARPPWRAFGRVRAWESRRRNSARPHPAPLAAHECRQSC